MLATVWGIVGVFVLLVWRSYRKGKRRLRDGDPFVPLGGQIRWEADGQGGGRPRA